MDSSLLQLRARITSNRVRLQLEYEVANAGSRPAFLFDILHNEWEDGKYPLDHGAYVEFSADAVVVSRKLFPAVGTQLVEQRNIPFCSRVMPGARHVGQLSLDLPLVPRNPFIEVQPGGRVGQRNVMFQIGYFWGADGTEQIGRTFPTDHGDRPGFDAFSQDSQLLVMTDPLGQVSCYMVEERG